MPDADVIVSWSFATVPQEARAAFQRPTAYVELPTPPGRAYGSQVDKLGWPRPIRTAIQQYLPGVTPRRVAVLGFSESCHGVRNLLKSGDGGYVDAAVAIDGVHTPYVGSKQVDPNTMRPWLDFGRLAVENRRLMVVTHSSVVPPGYASTTETASYLWKTLTGSSEASAEEDIDPPLPPLTAPPRTIHIAGGPSTGATRDVFYPAPPWLPFKRRGGLVILGAKNLDGPGTADHIYQARVVLPLVLTELLAARWNAIDPDDPGVACYIG